MDFKTTNQPLRVSSAEASVKTLDDELFIVDNGTKGTKTTLTDV